MIDLLKWGSQWQCGGLMPNVRSDGNAESLPAVAALKLPVPDLWPLRGEATGKNKRFKCSRWFCWTADKEDPPRAEHGLTVRPEAQREVWGDQENTNQQEITSKARKHAWLNSFLQMIFIACLWMLICEVWLLRGLRVTLCMMLWGLTVWGDFCYFICLYSVSLFVTWTNKLDQSLSLSSHRTMLLVKKFDWTEQTSLQVCLPSCKVEECMGGLLNRPAGMFTPDPGQSPIPLLYNTATQEATVKQQELLQFGSSAALSQVSLIIFCTLFCSITFWKSRVSLRLQHELKTLKGSSVD